MTSDIDNISMVDAHSLTATYATLHNNSCDTNEPNWPIDNLNMVTTKNRLYFHAIEPKRSLHAKLHSNSLTFKPKNFTLESPFVIISAIFAYLYVIGHISVSPIKPSL